MTLGACNSGDIPTEQDELWALLRDQDIPGITGAALAASQPGDVSAAGFNGFPYGQWSFDDCNPQRTNLFDSSPSGNTAFRAVAVTCAPGIAGLAVAIAAPEDIVYVPDQPDMTFETGVTVAAWFMPTALDKNRTLLRKRDKGLSSFALMMNSGKFQFVASLGGRAISVTAPAKARLGEFQHVAGTYDGHTLRLYVDGFEVRGLAASGVIPPGPGPVLMGNDGSERRFDGLIDQVLFEGRALSSAEIQALTCIRSTPTVEVTPQISEPTPPGVPASFDVAVTNHDSPACPALTFQLRQFNFFSGITIDPPPFSPAVGPPVASGETGHLTMTATAADTVEPATFPLFFEVSTTDFSFFTTGIVQFVVSEPTGCHVSIPRELMIRDVSVVDDPVRTTSSGAWTFKHLMENIAPTPEEAPAMVEAMLATFTTEQTINGFAVGPRPRIQNRIFDLWPRTTDGRLDLDQSPLRLLAIVNRFDVRNLADGDAGEGRFVFGFSPLGFPIQATLILEYKLPAGTEDDVLAWAESFHALGALPFSEEYNAALQAITERFVARGARPDGINGSALAVLRTNEVDFSDDFVWEMREFVLSPATGHLVPATIKLTPDRSFNFSDALAGFINANEAAIIAETHTVPDLLDGQPFLAGAVFNDLGTWFAPGVNSEARHHFALNTCNGCHSIQEAGTEFLQIRPRFFGQQSDLSPFLTGVTVFDPSTGTPRTLNDLARRSADLKAVVCDGLAGLTLQQGIRRAH